MNRFTPASPRIRKIGRSVLSGPRPRTAALVFAVFALSVQLSGLAEVVQQRGARQPAQTERKAVVKPAPQSPGAAQAAPITVLTPAAGQTIALDGKVLQIQFGYKNLDVNKSYSYMPELVRNGAALGPVFGTGFVVNKSQSSAAVGVTSGHYLANFTGHLAQSGPGYQYRITIYEGTWGKGHKVAATGLSGQFSFGAAPVPAGPVQVTVLTPAAGQAIALDGKVLQIQFGYKNLDVNKNYSFMPELMKNGAALGPAFGTGFVVNKSKSSAVVGVTSGYYLANFAGKTASSGSGYQYRITIYEGTWGKGHKVAAAGLSGQFTFKTQ